MHHEKGNINMSEDLYQKTMDLIDKLTDLDRLILDKTGLLTDLRAKQAKEKLEVSLQVLDAVDEKGKAVYSNAEKRDAETQSRLNENIDYIESCNAANELTNTIAYLKIDAEMYRMRIRTLQAFAHTQK